MKIPANIFASHRNLAIPAICAVLLVSIPSCQIFNDPAEVQRTNILDPLNPVYELPSATFRQAPESNSVLLIDEVQFAWNGNLSAEYMLYCYRMDATAWSPWVRTTAVSYSSLDEGSHIFELLSSYVTGVRQSAPTVVPFSVNFYQTVTLTLRPAAISPSADSTFQLQFGIGHAPAFASAHIVFQYDPAFLRARSVILESNPGSFLRRSGGLVTLITVVNDTLGIATVDINVLHGVPAGISGTGQFGLITFGVMALPFDTLNITFNRESQLRDSTSATISIGQFNKTIVVRPND